MPAETVTNAVAQRNDSPAALVKAYQNDFATVLPSHVRPETWVRLAQGALRRNRTLFDAAKANPNSLIAALLDAARLGLEPGTEQYYLVPYKDRGAPIVQGIPGYQGEIELMYRAGAVSSVVVELVKERDVFRYQPGRDERPHHEVDWFGDRGALRGVYSYAVMSDGATSKVVVLSEQDVNAARASSASWRSDRSRPSSPWTTHTEAMWLKTAAHRLRKWVPTSAEYRREIARASAEAHRVTEERELPEPATPDVLDGEVVDAPADWPATAEPASEDTDDTP